MLGKIRIKVHGKTVDLREREILQQCHQSDLNSGEAWNGDCR